MVIKSWRIKKREHYILTGNRSKWYLGTVLVGSYLFGFAMRIAMINGYEEGRFQEHLKHKTDEMLNSDHKSTETTE